jgi:hypothetical protein
MIPEFALDELRRNDRHLIAALEYASRQRERLLASRLTRARLAFTIRRVQVAR